MPAAGSRASSWWAAGCALSLALVLGGCVSNDDDPAPTGSGATTGSSGASGSGSASASPSPSVTDFAQTCGSALSVVDVSAATGQPIIGETAFVVGEADPTIGRLAYLNCRYGLSAPTANDPQLEIGVSLYSTADQATTRVAGTVEDYRSSGATASEVRVGPSSGTVLITPNQPALLVAAQGARTVAVSLSGALYTGEAQLTALGALAFSKVS